MPKEMIVRVTSEEPSHRWTRPARVAAALTVVLALLGVVEIAGQQASSAVSLSPSGTAAFAGDAGDPDVVYSAGTYFAFTTGTPLGNHIQALVSTGPSRGYHSYTGQSFGSTALANPPGWETTNTQTSPGVFDWGGRWLMYYDAAQSPNPSDSGHDCISVAVGGATLSSSDPEFTDTSGGGMICQPTGSIDPSPFVDPTTGKAYLIWKQNDGGSAAQAKIWSQQLSADGLSLVGSPSELMFNNTVAYPWENTVEDPSMVDAGGTYELLFSAGVYTSSGYSEGITTCSGPLGPCGSDARILTTYGSALGPGGGSLFADATGNFWLDYAAWQGGSSGCTNYSCGATRQLFVTAIGLSLQVACSPPAVESGYRFVASDGGIFDYGSLPFCGSMGGQPLTRPVVGLASTPDDGGYWEVASDGGIFASGDAGFYGSMGGKALVKPVVGIAATPDGHGYWEVASDGGIFAFGNARFYGSMGGIPLTRPIVGISSTPDGGGYWEVASDGGIFAFGDAAFYGSMGGKALAKPVVGIATTPDGHGYWEVATDGGIFAFGDAGFDGSMGGKPLNRPVVGIGTTADGHGYWEVASDGGIFAFGDATFDGSAGGAPLVKPVVGMSG
jgi:Glycosyl hydrolases family 43